MALAPGTQLGPYELVSPLGAGGMGEVWLARDTRLDRTVAVKVMRGGLGYDRRRFEREGRVIAALQHPHICALHDIGTQDGIDYLVMEHLQGETLAERLAKGQLAVTEALTYGTQIADALDQAHRVGIIHRDLKPANVMLTRTGVKLLDFGLAKAVAAASAGVSGSDLTLTVPITRERTVVGTLPYMAPEQLDGREADVRTDIFALGAVLHEMFTGRRAFDGKSPPSVMAAVLEHEPPRASTLRPLIPQTLDIVVMQCLSKRPDDRWQSARDVMLALRSIDVSAADITPGRRTILPWAIAGACLLLAVAAVGWAVFRRPAASPVYRLSVMPPAGAHFMFAVTKGGSAISPDGRSIAFAAGYGDNFSLWVRDLHSSEPRSLPGTAGAYNPFWSADGKSLAFFADGKLYRINAGGDSLKVLCPVAQGRGGTWNEAGEILFASFFDRRIYRVPASGGSPVPVTRLDDSRGETLHRWPYFLPDGRRFLYHIAGRRPELSGIYWGSLDFAPESQPRIRLVDGRSNPAYSPPQGNTPANLLFVRNGELHAQPVDSDDLRHRGESVTIARGISFLDSQLHADYSVSRSNVVAYGTVPTTQMSRVVWYTRQGQPAGAIAEAERHGSVRLSPDDTRVALTRASADTDIWVMDARRGATSRFSFDSGLDTSPVWSPDSSRIAYSSATGLTIRPSTGGEPAPIRRCSMRCTPTDWSHDGRWLLFSELDTSWDIWRAPADDATKAVRLRATPYQETHARFSPDGRYIVYASNESGSFEIYVSAVRDDGTAGARWQLSTKGGVLPIWSRDGREIFFLNREADRKLMSVSVKTRGSALEAGVPVALFSTNLPETAFSLPLSSQPFDVSSDRSRILILTAADDTHRDPLTIILNWHSLLRR